MKYMCKYLLAILPFFFILISCDNDDPSYSQLELDTNEVQFNYVMDASIIGQKEIHIVNGNGNYILSQQSNNLTSREALDKIKEIEAEDGNADTIVVAVAKLDGNKLIVTPKYTGTIQYKLQDWTKSNQIITIVVDQDKVNEEIITQSSVFDIRVGDEIATDIYSGNGGYKVESLDPSIATVSLDGLEIKAVAVATGNTKIRITDQKGEEGFIEVKVDDALVPLVLLGVEAGQKVWLTTGGVDNAVLHYEGGNGGLVRTSSAYDNDVVIDEGAQTITVSGKTSRTMTTLKLSDRYGQEITVDLAIDYPFLTDTRSRLLRDNKFTTFSANQRIAEYIPSLNRTIIQSGSTGNWGSGVGITFTGDMSLGKKTDAKLYKISGAGIDIDATPTLMSECEIVKIENKIFWITFTQKETGEKGYIVISIP